MHDAGLSSHLVNNSGWLLLVERISSLVLARFSGLGIEVWYKAVRAFWRPLSSNGAFSCVNALFAMCNKKKIDLICQLSDHVRAKKIWSFFGIWSCFLLLKWTAVKKMNNLLSIEYSVWLINDQLRRMNLMALLYLVEVVVIRDCSPRIWDGLVEPLI